MADVVRLLFSLRGQIGRLQFWTALAVLVTLAVLTRFADALVQLTLGFRSAAFDLVLYAFTASTIVLMVKRFNDLGWPPWIVCASVAINWLAYFAQSSGVVGEGAARAAVFFWV